MQMLFLNMKITNKCIHEIRFPVLAYTSISICMNKHCTLQNCLIKPHQCTQQYLLPGTSISKILRLIQIILYFDISWLKVGTADRHVVVRRYSHDVTAESTNNEDFRGIVTRRIICSIKRVAEPTFINVIKITELFLIPDKSNFSPLIWVSTIITIMLSLLMILSIIQQQRYVYYDILVVDYLNFYTVRWRW